jgi:hypothetical protein
MGADNRTIAALWAAAYSGSSFALSPVGEASKLDATKLSDLEAVFLERICARNMSLVIAGPINPETVRANATRVFQGLKPGQPIQFTKTKAAKAQTSANDKVYFAVPGPGFDEASRYCACLAYLFAIEIAVEGSAISFGPSSAGSIAIVTFPSSNAALPKDLAEQDITAAIKRVVSTFATVRERPTELGLLHGLALLYDMPKALDEIGGAAAKLTSADVRKFAREVAGN